MHLLVRITNCTRCTVCTSKCLLTVTLRLTGIFITVTQKCVYFCLPSLLQTQWIWLQVYPCFSSYCSLDLSGGKDHSVHIQWSLIPACALKVATCWTGSMEGLSVDTLQGWQLCIPAFEISREFKQDFNISWGFPLTTEARTFRRRQFTMSNLTLNLHRHSVSGSRIARCLQWRVHLARTFPVFWVSNRWLKKCLELATPSRFLHR